jgi:histone H3/H4
MLTPQQRQQFQQADSDLDGLTAARLDDLLSVLSVSNPLEFKAGVLDTVPGLVAELSDVSALIGADMYETAREQAEARGRFTVDLADPPPVEQVEASSRWALGPLFQAESTLTFAEVAALVSANLEASTARLVRDGGRRTVTRNTERDPAKPRYQRFLSARSKHCDFCTMLAGRGAVYHTKDAAGVGKHWHDRCHCYVDLVFN